MKKLTGIAVEEALIIKAANADYGSERKHIKELL